MLIRNELPDGHRLRDEGVTYHRLFLGDCFGVGLRFRGRDDNHVCFDVLVQDDENWFVGRGGGSTSWIGELTQVLVAAEQWCVKNCKPDVVNGNQYGWRFRFK